MNDFDDDDLFGEPEWIDTPAVREAAVAVGKVYEFNGVGGNLHALVDDCNVEDALMDAYVESIAENFHKLPPEALAAERHCLQLLRALTEDERDSAIGLWHGRWDSPDFDRLEHPDIDPTTYWVADEDENYYYEVRYRASARIVVGGHYRWFEARTAVPERAPQHLHEEAKRRIAEELRRKAAGDLEAIGQ